MIRRHFFAVAGGLTISTRVGAQQSMSVGYTPPGGARLTEFLDALPVTTRWIHRHRIVWQTGQQNAPDFEGPMAHTHCSAFVAAVALMLDIYFLRPPFHSQELLANAQADWLAGSGNFRGPIALDSKWRALGASGTDNALDASLSAAASGQLVVAIYKAAPVTDSEGRSHQRHGHVCIVRPPRQTSPPRQEGPDVISVGDVNRPCTSMRTAFHAHPGAWPNEIQLYAHSTDLESDSL
jgi:hypothetical protein